MRFTGSVVTLYATAVLALQVDLAGVFRDPWFFGVVFAALSSAGFVGGVALFFRKPYGFAPAASFVGAMLALGVYFFFARVWFIVDNGAMDDGSSSPLAFLIGWAWQQTTITLPALLVSFLLWDLAPFNRSRAA